MKIWSIEDNHISEDLAELHKRFSEASNKEATVQNEEGDFANDESEDGFEDATEVLDVENGIGNNVSETDEELHHLFDINGDDQLQVETDGSHPQQQGGDASIPQLGGDESPPAANTRSKYRCSTCCCRSHHKLAMHTKAKELKPIAMAVDLALPSTLYMEKWGVEKQAIQKDTLDDMIMSIGGKLKL